MKEVYSMNVYENSREDARELGEIELWRESRRLNRACSDAITQAIQEHFDGMYLDSGCEKPVIEQYGFARIMWVLAATMKYKDHDGRFSRENREWADTILPGWLSREEFADYICDSHPAVLDGFIREVRKAYDALGLLGKEQCLPDSYKQDFKEQLLIMKPKVLAEPFKRPEFQYFYATCGFGCDPGKLGTKVYGFFLKDHDPGEFRRSDFLGVADETKLPEWAEKRLSEIRAPLMQIRVFQIDRELDAQHKMFRNFEETAQLGGVDSSIYRQIYGGTVNCRTLDDVFALCNHAHPPGYLGHSLSLSDVVEICSGEDKGFYFCDSFGFQKIDFDTAKTNHEAMLRVLICEPGKEPYTAEICDDLKGLQSVVGGYIEPIYFDPAHKALVYCDEEFLFKDYVPNRVVGDCLVHGTFLIVGDGVNDEGERISVSLTDAQIEQFSEDFRYPLIYLEHSGQDVSEDESFDFSMT